MNFEHNNSLLHLLSTSSKFYCKSEKPKNCYKVNANRKQIVENLKLFWENLKIKEIHFYHPLTNGITEIATLVAIAEAITDND